MSFELTALLLAWVAILLLALAVSGLLRQVRALNLRPTAVRLETNTAVGKTIALDTSMLDGHAPIAVLLFVTPDCQVCQARLQDLEKLTASDTIGFSVAAVFPGAANGFRSSSIRVLENQKEVFERLQIPVTPFGVVLSKEGVVIRSAPVGSPEAVRELVEQARFEDDDAKA